MIVDAHQHFWRIDRGVYDWIDDSIPALRRDYMPEHLQAHLKLNNVSKTILVQASETDEENIFLISLAQNFDFVGGIIAWVDLDAPGAISILQDLAKNPLIKGIRPVLQAIEDSHWILKDNVMACLRELPKLGLRFDALIQARHIGAIVTLAQKIPELNIVIDHASKPSFKNGIGIAPVWRDQIKQFADLPQVYCKMSGLITEYGAGWSVNSLQSVVDHILDVFSPSRIMWGSDWPVLELDATYSEWFESTQKLIKKCSPADKEEIMGGTASRFYGLNE